VPFGFVSYPFDWILPMLIIGFALLILFIFIGLGKQILRIEEIIKGFVPLLGAMITAGLLTYISWKLLLNFYPEYQDILQGFTYNGQDYCYAFICLTLGICFLFYQNNGKRHPEMNQVIAPLFLWLLLNTGVALKLKGAGLMIVPVLSTALMLGFFVLTQKSNWVVNCILAIPTLIILAPLIQMFPVGLGLKVMFGTSILTVLTFALLLPIFGSYEKKGIWATFFILLAIGLFIKAHQESGYTYGKAKPNSLVYALDTDSNKAFWTTYDVNLDEWTKAYLGDNPKSGKPLNTNKLYSKYGSEFTFMSEAPMKNIAQPTIEFLRDTVKGNQHLYRIKISPNRTVNRYDIFNNKGLRINNFKANGVTSIEFKSNISGKTDGKLLSYYVVDNIPLELEFSIPANQKLDLDLVESSFDLMTNPQFSVAKRKSWMIPTPFVLNDAVMIRQKLKAPAKPVSAPTTTYRRHWVKDSASVTKDTLRR